MTLIGQRDHDAELIELAPRLARRAADDEDVDASRHAGLRPSPRRRRRDLLAVVGAHLSGLPLNHQLTDVGATLDRATRTAAIYRLYALSGTAPPKPGLVRVGADDGSSIELEIWRIGHAALGRLAGGVSQPLSIGAVELVDGSTVTGFVCDSGVPGPRGTSPRGAVGGPSSRRSAGRPRWLTHSAGGVAAARRRSASGFGAAAH